MKNLKRFVDAHPFSSTIQPSNDLNYFSNLFNGISSFDIDELETDWADSDPFPFDIPSLDSDPSPVRPVEMLQFDPTDNKVFETSPLQPSPSCNQVNNENDSSRLTPLVTPRPDLSPAPGVAMPPQPPPSPPRDQAMNIENGFNPTSFDIPCPDLNMILDRQVLEMLQFDPTEDMVFEMPMPPTSPPLYNQTIDGENGFNPNSFVIPCPDPNPTSRRKVEMPARFDPVENMVIENSWKAMQPSSSSLPCNQTMNLENNLNPTPFFIPVLDPNQELVKPVEMHEEFNRIENRVFENQWIARSSSSSAKTENLEFRPFSDEYKTNIDIICKNYLEAYRVDSSSARTVVDRNGAAAFNNLLDFNNNNALFFSSGSEMQYFPGVAAFSTFTEFLPRCNEVEAATHSGTASSTFKRKWSVQEHRLFLVGMEIYGKGDWTNIADKVVITKSNTQVSSHAQKFFIRLTLPRQTKGKKRASIHDITTVDPDLLSKVRDRLRLSSFLPRLTYKLFE